MLMASWVLAIFMSTIPFQSLRTLRIKPWSFWLKPFSLLGCEYFQAQHDPNAWRKHGEVCVCVGGGICLNKQKIFKRCCWAGVKYAPFILTLLLVKVLLSADWWESIADVKYDNWRVAGAPHILYVYTTKTHPGWENKWRYLKKQSRPP